MDIVYDVIIIGGGAAGVLAAIELASSTNLTVAVLEKAKRLNDARNIGYCWLGASARSSARLFKDPTFGGSGFSDMEWQQFAEHMRHYYGSALKFKSQKLAKKVVKAAAEGGFNITGHDACVLSEEQFIRCADRMHMVLKRNINIIHKCDLEGIEKVPKSGTTPAHFLIKTDDFSYKAKKVILSTGRSSQQWWEDLPKNFSPEFESDRFNIGLRIEMPAFHLDSALSKEFEHKVHWNNWEMSMPIRKMNVETEEVGDLKISNSRQCHNGKKTYTSFSITREICSANPAADQQRLVALSNVLSDFQLVREPVSKILAGQSMLSPIPEYAAFATAIRELSKLIPQITNRAMVFGPEASLNVRKYKVSAAGETTASGFYMMGDVSGHQRSFVQAAISGLRVANGIIAATEKNKLKKKEELDYATIESASRKKAEKDD
jgi:thioredoxin reductase